MPVPAASQIMLRMGWHRKWVLCLLAGCDSSQQPGLPGGQAMTDNESVPQKKKSGLATASLVCGICGLAYPTSILFLASIAGVVCGHVALVRIKKKPAEYAGFKRVIAGLVLGYIALAVLVAITYLKADIEASIADLAYLVAKPQGNGKPTVAAGDALRKAADGGDADAMFKLGFMCEEGRGVEKDERVAVSWYRKAAEGGNGIAMCNLGVMYAQGRGVPKDEREAVSWFRKAAERGNTDAMRNLGLMCADGRGVAKDDREAVSWHRKSAEGGNTLAMATLGLMYEEGRGVVEDEREAASWYHKAAEGGNTLVMGKLGLMYLLGQGVAENESEAYVWFAMASAFGDEKARKLRDSIEEGLPAQARLAAQERSRVLFEQISRRVGK
ncbi:MAG: SEL1-like repeat protein [Planctomycetes bacterium]|nr:SEL1-like repeat protein [Planctomycetota bacterium]